MNIEMQQADRSEGLDTVGWDIALRGEVLDDRGAAACEFATGVSGQSVEIRYDAEQMTLGVDGTTCDVEDLHAYLPAGRTYVLESTTLGFAEILLICRSLREKGVPAFDCLYVEPRRYSEPKRREVLHRREFGLSDSVSGYRGIPGSIVLLTPRARQRAFFFLGFEQERLDRAFEEFPVDAGLAQVAFGIPAYKAGWEMDAIANNAPVMREKSILGAVHFCGADNPLAAYELLEKVRQSLGDGEQLVVAPVGTKPHGIGAALFVTEHPLVGVLYDHPKRSPGRSESVEKWHLFSCEMA